MTFSRNTFVVKNKIQIFIFFIVLLGSCKRDDEVIPVTNTIYSGIINYFAEDIEYDSAYWPYITNSLTYNAYGQFYKTPQMSGNEWELVGDLMVGNYNVPVYNYTRYEFASFQRNDSINITQFGKKINFSISGGGDYIAAFSSVYVPSVIFIHSPKEFNDIHNRSDSMIITWNSDPNNKNVEISLYYDGTKSQANNSLLDSLSYFSVPIIAPDNGQYILPSSLFKTFGSGSVIEIIIDRIGKGEMKSNNHLIEINVKTSSLFGRTLN